MSDNVLDFFGENFAEQSPQKCTWYFAKFSREDNGAMIIGISIVTLPVRKRNIFIL